MLQERCPECGFAAPDVRTESIARTAREFAARWSAALHRPDARVRPAPGTWSALEYGAHVRDVHRVFTERLRRMLTEEDPVFDSWDQDATAVRDRYDLQDPAMVAEEQLAAAAGLADLFDTVTGAQWDRRGRRSDGSVLTVRTLGQLALHEAAHHLHDVAA